MFMCGTGRCGDSSSNRRAKDMNCCSIGGTYVKCPRRSPCCPLESPPCPDYCPFPPKRYFPPPCILPLSCPRPNIELVPQQYIINAIQTACRPPLPYCCDAPCGPKGTVINFIAPNHPLPKRSEFTCPTGY